MRFPVFSLCPLPLFLSLDTTEKSPALSSLLPPIRLYTWIRSNPEPSFLQVEQSQLYRLFVSDAPLSTFWGAWSWTWHSKSGLTSADQRGRITCWKGSSSCSPGGCGPLSWRGVLWLMCNPVSTNHQPLCAVLSTISAVEQCITSVLTFPADFHFWPGT